MGLFKILEDLAEMPIRAAVDIVRIPGKILNGEEGLLYNTSKGIDKIEEDLNED